MTTILERVLLDRALREFQRTHRNGLRQLLDWIRVQPIDRTEEEYVAERAAAEAENERQIEQALRNFNAGRIWAGLRLIGRDGSELERGATPRS